MGGGPANSNRASPGLNGNVNQGLGSPPNLSPPLGSRLPQANAPAVPQHAMSIDMYNPTAVTSAGPPMNNSFSHAFPPIGHPATFENQIPASMRLAEPERLNRGMNGTHNGLNGGAVIVIRGLPRNASYDSLRNMLLFAKDIVDAEFVPNEPGDDPGFSTAVARFHTLEAAHQARDMLDGKPNSTNEANMIVEVVSPHNTAPSAAVRRYTIDNTPRGAINPRATSMAPGPAPRQQAPRYAYQNLENHPNPNIPANNDLPTLQAIFSPQSAIGNTVNENQRGTGKRMIDQEADEETPKLVNNSAAAFMQDGHTGPSMPRRSTNPTIPVGRFSNLTLSTNVGSQQVQNYQPARSAVTVQTPSAAMSPVGNMGANNGYGFPTQNLPSARPNFPPANPADQNPPCNTLYVGNLPMDASEDELKALFSKQRGYKRLCFRTKQNGPMCFVEFEDVTLSIKSLKELYGHVLSNSVKGGIRLSFSKNPLGVRNGQPGSMNPSTPMTPHGQMAAANGFGANSTPQFTNANGPPPGLQAPPGLVPTINVGNGGMHGNNPLQSPGLNGPNSNHASGINNYNINGRNPTPGGPTTPGAVNNMNGGNTSFADYLMGR